ncbi:MAG: YceI family protein [Pseudonocardia sp.]|nr:YceI family protein [Pseudonocardia sp.]
MTTTTCAPAPSTLLDPATGLPAPGRWRVVAAASRLYLDATFRGLFGIRGRFTDLAGYIDVGDDLAGCRMRIDVAAASLTTGSATRDAMLTAAGLIDPDAGPALRFRSRALAHNGAGLVVEGLVGTDRAVAPLRLDVATPRVASGPILTLRAGGAIGRDAIGALLTRPGVERLLGATSKLDLTVALQPAQ